MRRFGAYLLAQLKRVRQIFPFITAMTLLFTLCLLLLAMLLQQADAASEKKQKIQIGLVGDMDTGYLNFGVMALQRLDISRYAIDFEVMEESEAVRSLEMGEITAYIVIPDGFAEAFDKGEAVQITYATASDGAGLGALLMDELVGMISDVMVESRSAVNGTWQVMYEGGAEEDFAKATDRLFLRFVEMILNRDIFYGVTFCGVAENLSLTSYYFVGIMLLFMLLWGITASPLFVRRDAAFQRFLKSRGQGTICQVLAEYLAYLTLMLSNLFLMILPVETVFWVLGIQVREWADEPVLGILLFLVKMIPAAALLAALQFMLYELISDMVSGILLQFVAGIGLGYLSGCIYPLSVLPEGLQTLAPFIPTGAALLYGTGCMRGELPWKELGMLLLYLFSFLGLAAAIRERKVKCY